MLKQIAFDSLNNGIIAQGNYGTIKNMNPKIYTTGTTKLAIPGTRSMTWDGRVFKYGYSKSAVKSGFGVYNDVGAGCITGANAPATWAIGDTRVAITIGATDGYGADGAIAENELVGAYVVAGHDELAVVQNRMIIANTAVAAGGGTCYITLDGAVTNTITTSGYVETVLNPYGYLKGGQAAATDYKAWMGIPSVNAATATYFWLQTWGPCWVTPGGSDTTPGDTADDRTAYFVGDGSVNFGYALTVESGYQKAGFCIDSTASGTSAMPLIMLQISV